MRKCWITIFVCLAALQAKCQLVINELSQGPSGTKEYVEFLVTGTVSCGGTNTVDLRGWIIDDNNSWHASGSGTGIATGHAKFDSIPQWANVKIGSLILVYNDADVSAATAALRCSRASLPWRRWQRSDLRYRVIARLPPRKAGCWQSRRS